MVDMDGVVVQFVVNDNDGEAAEVAVKAPQLKRRPWP
jgi:hypothetical protein